MKKYRKSPSAYITAVQLNLETEGFTYRKWGALQTCKPGDWVVDNAGDTYTIARETFAQTYRMVSPGVFYKMSEVYAEVAAESGEIRTQEGSTHYEAGDYLVYNNPDQTDGYAISREKFERMYEEIE